MRSRIKQQLPSGSDSAAADEATTEVRPFWQQGDSAMYTPEVLVKRSELFDDPAVREVLHVWWETALRSLHSSGEAEADTTAIPQAQYILMQRKIYKAMMEEFDEADASRCALEDWERDARGESTLSRKLFCDGLFEVGALRLADSAPQPMTLNIFPYEPCEAPTPHECAVASCSAACAAG